MKEQDPQQQTVWVVSDVHLDVSPDADDRVRSNALARFLSHLTETQCGPSDATCRLVILGDLMNLPSDDVDSARVAVDRIAAVHESVFLALTQFVSSGSEVVVIPGNHDVALATNGVFSAFRDRIVADPDHSERVVLAPWIYYIRDVLYAEHGNQYHDINWFPTLLNPTYPGDDHRLHRTSAAWLELLRAPHGFRRPVLRATVNHAIGLADSLRHEPSWSMLRETYISSFVHPYGTSIGIGSATASALDAVGVRGPLSVGQRLVRRTVLRLRDRLWGHRSASSLGSRDRYMRRAVREIVEVTRSHNVGVPFYVFGHTHVARCCRIDDDATYLNSGTWSGQLPDERGSDPERWLTLLKVTNASATLMSWDDTASIVQTLQISHRC